MDIDKILEMLGLDLSNPEVKRGALDAIEAILSSRIPQENLDGGAGLSNEIDLELDPDLIQPSIKHQATNTNNDIEVEDEDNVLDSIKHNKPDEPYEDNTSGEENSSTEDDSSESNNTEDSKSTSNNTGAASNDEEEIDNAEANSEETEKSDADEEVDTYENEEESIPEKESETNTSNDLETEYDEFAEDEVDLEDSEEDEELEIDSDHDEGSESQSSKEDTIEGDEDELEDDDYLDDETKNLYNDKEIDAKQEARRIKRERTILAAKRALDKAKGQNVNASLIRELEKSIEALETLQEAAKKSLKNISDEEFDLMINRVLDAIDAVGNSELTVKTAKEKELQAQEIKQDLSKAETKNELSAEDIAKIRQETQAIKAREKEKAKYQRRSASSFKGFKAFLDSLYRAVAMQVKVNEVQDDSWSALSRRNSGVGVLKQGKKINELPDAKIPVIDFYFDCSGSWRARDIEIGKKAVEALVEMEEKGQIKINVYYFADNVHTNADDARLEVGTRAWNEIVKNVIATKATNVIIMTDSDMENRWQGPKALTYTVPGYVWYLWRDGDNAPRLPRDLKGRGGTQQFSFSHGDL